MYNVNVDAVVTSHKTLSLRVMAEILYMLLH